MLNPPLKDGAVQAIHSKPNSKIVNFCQAWHQEKFIRYWKQQPTQLFLRQLSTMSCMYIIRGGHFLQPTLSSGKCKLVFIRHFHAVNHDF